MSTITTADKFIRTDDFASRVDEVFLPDEAWAVFAELEHPASAEEIAARVGQTPDEVLAALTTLREHRLARKQLKSWRDFVAQKGTPPGGSGPGTSPTAPVVDALNAGRPGAALAGWPKPSAPTPPPAATVQEAPPAPARMPAAEPPPAVLADIPAAPVATTPPPPAAPVAPAPESAPVLFTDFQLPAKPLHQTHNAIPPAGEPPVPAVVPPPAPVEPAAIAVSAPAQPAPREFTPALVTAAPATPAQSGRVLPVSFSIVNDKARFERRAAAAMTISFRITAAAAPAATSWKLRPLLQAIEQKGGGGLPGQLLVYRVFIHVPADLMHAAGIQSISLVDDSVVIRDRAFYDALCQAAHAVASLDLRTVKA